MRCRELNKYKFGLLGIERTSVNLPDVQQDSFSRAYGYIDVTDGILTIQKGYAWDGSSVPFKGVAKFLSFGLWDSDKYCKKASLVHDALCQLIRAQVLDMRHKQYADRLYCQMCIEGGMKEKQANLRYKMLRKFGDGFVQPTNKPKDIVWEV